MEVPRKGWEHPATRTWQAILNEAWPDHPRAYRTHWPGIAVKVRVVWERDGEETLPGFASRWDRNHVYVELWRLSDKRLVGQGVWVRPEDVERLTPPPPSD